MSITVILIILICIVSVSALGKPELRAKLLMNPYRVEKHKEYYRFVTSGFVHGSYMHLGFNMFTFYFFGEAIEGLLGPTLFIILFISGIIISDIPSFLKYKNAPHYNSLGASGGVSSILFASILYQPMTELMIFPIPIPIKGFILGILYLIYSYYSGKQSKDNINHDAHLFGALYGLLFAFIANPDLAQQGIQAVLNWRPF